MYSSNPAGNATPLGQAGPSSLPTFNNAQMYPAPNVADNRPISIIIRRISIKYDKVPSPLKRSESVEEEGMDPRVVLQTCESPAPESDSDDGSVVLEMNDLSGTSRHSGDCEEIDGNGIGHKASR